MRVHGRTDDAFTVRGISVYPSAVQTVVSETAPEVTGRIKLLRSEGATASPTRVMVEVRDGAPADPALADRIADAIHGRLHFRAAVDLVPTERFGSAGYKTPLTGNDPGSAATL